MLLLLDTKKVIDPSAQNPSWNTKNNRRQHNKFYRMIELNIGNTVKPQDDKADNKEKFHDSSVVVMGSL
jgi:hypothetical protein